MLHDPHMNPEPILVASGLTYLFPFYIALQKNKIYDASTYLFLTFTTVGFHSTRSEYLFFLDCLAIINFLVRSYYISLDASQNIRYIYYLSVSYSLISYFVGRKYKIMSFNPDWNTQMFYHSLMHISTSYSAYKLISQ
jgi:hypothetical protein